MLLDIENFPNYKVDTNNWLIYSLNILKHLKLQINKKGYYTVTLCHNGKSHSFPLHIIIYKTVYGKIPKGYQIHHIDYDKTNNNPSNLMLIDPSKHLSLHKTGNVPSEKTRQKMSISAKKRNCIITPEMRAKMVAGHIGKKHKPSVHLTQRKPILMIDKNNQIIKEYPYVNATAVDGFKPSNVSQCCQGTRKTHHGFIFQYKN